MDSDTDPQLRELLARYTPSIPEEPFLTEACRRLERAERKARLRSAAGYAIVLGLGAWIAVSSFGALEAWSASIEALLGRLTAGVSPLAAQLSVYGATVAVGLLVRRRIAAFLAPW